MSIYLTTRKVALLIIALICYVQINAQEVSLLASNPPKIYLVTDRPDQTESAVVIPAWRLQIETGLAKEWVNTGTDSYDEKTRFGTTLLRFGLFDFMEFRLGSDMLNNRQKLPAGVPRDDLGISPIGFGFKFAIAKENGIVPDIALITSWQIPNTGNTAYSSDKWQHSFVFSFAHTLSERWGLGYNLGYEFERSFDVSAFKYTLAGGYSIAERWGVYIELYGGKVSTIPWDLRTDAGITFLLFPNFQLDFSGGAGLTENSHLGYISLGLSWRIPR
jgi:hypothetical protein